MQIKSGQFAQLPGIYSSELRALVAAMLQTTAARRPSVQLILQSPLIRNRIEKFLSETYRCISFDTQQSSCGVSPLIRTNARLRTYALMQKA